MTFSTPQKLKCTEPGIGHSLCSLPTPFRNTGVMLCVRVRVDFSLCIVTAKSLFVNLLDFPFLSFIRLGTLRPIPHASANELPRQRQHFSCRLIATTTFNKPYIGLEHKIRILKSVTNNMRKTKLYN